MLFRDALSQYGGVGGGGGRGTPPQLYPFLVLSVATGNEAKRIPMFLSAACHAPLVSSCWAFCVDAAIACSQEVHVYFAAWPQIIRPPFSSFGLHAVLLQ